MTEQLRYSQMSEEEAAQYFESRKQNLLGNLIEHYKTVKNKSPSQPKHPPQQKPKIAHTFVVYKRHESPKQSKPKLKFVKEEPAQEQLAPPPQPEIQAAHPLKMPSKKLLLSDIGNLDLEIQRLTREVRDPQPIQQPQANPQRESIPIPEQRPLSKQSRISDASYTKHAACFKGVIRSQSLKKLQNLNNSKVEDSTRMKYSMIEKPKMPLRAASEKRIDNSMKVNTNESEKIEKKVVQSERKVVTPKPIIKMLPRSQSKQDTPKAAVPNPNTSVPNASAPTIASMVKAKMITPKKSAMKVQWSEQQTKSQNNVLLAQILQFYKHKESFNSQNSFQKKNVEAQIEEAVQLYNTLKSIIGNKANVLQAQKPNIMPRKTADFFVIQQNMQNHVKPKELFQ